MAMTNTAMHAANAVAGVSGGAASLLAGIPLPDNLEKWPVVALLTLIALVALSVAVLCIRINDRAARAREKSALEQAAALSKLAIALTQGNERQSETNKRLDEMCEKQGDALVFWAGRPCLRGAKGDKGIKGDKGEKGDAGSDGKTA